jgi:hypothetical protein
VASQFESIFVRLRAILQRNAGTLTVEDDSPRRFGLEGSAGPATLRAWRGEVRKAAIPVAWVQVGKASVSFHLMGIDGNPKLREGMSKELNARMHGKTCFNFSVYDEALFQELERLTIKGIAAFIRAGYVSDGEESA